MSVSSLQILLPFLILIPFLGAAAGCLLPVNWRSMAGLGSVIVTALISLLVVTQLAASGPLEHRIGDWSPPLGIRLILDGWGAVFLLLTSVVSIPLAFFARTFFTRPDIAPQARLWFWPLWLLVYGAINGLCLSADLFNLYVLLEIITLGSVGLAILSGQTKAYRAGLRYLLAALTGSMAFLMGVTLLYGLHGVLDLHLLGARISGLPLENLALGLLTVGLIIKTALFPFHFWLPGAHSAALPPVSALLSAIIVKASFFLLVRIYVIVYPGQVSFAAGQVLGAMGAIAVVWGSYQALRQTQLKRMVAHSTVGQVGYLFLLFPFITAPVATETLAFAWTGCTYQFLAHGMAKAAMFLAVGLVVLAVGNDDKGSLLNMVGRRPMTTFTLALAGISLIGLPPSGGFIAKWMLLKASFASGQWWWVPMIVWGSFLTAGYVFMVLRIAFAPAPPGKPLREVPASLEITAFILGLAAFIIGLRAEEVMALLEIGFLPFAPQDDPSILSHE